MSSGRVVVNGFFRPQAITGQQRFATEIASRLPERLAGVEVTEVGPHGTGSGRSSSWLEMHLRLHRRARGALLVSMTSRAPFGVRNHLVTVHDLFPLTNPEWFSSAFLRLHAPLLEHHLRSAAGLVAVSPVVADRIRERIGDRAPVFVVPNAVSSDLDAPATGDTDHGWVDLPDEFFLAVGSLDPRKNFRALVDAYAGLPDDVRHDAPLVVVGASAASFASTDSGHRAVDGVRFLGRVPDVVLASLYRRASVFVSPSLDEGFGIPVIEADRLGHGPLVLSDIPSYRWLAAETAPVWVDPMSVESIRTGLRTAWLDHRSGNRRSPTIASRFSWDASADAMADAIRSTLARTFGV
jgi:glycosyltransferase involved in cell wall biosynthesis